MEQPSTVLGSPYSSQLRQQVPRESCCGAPLLNAGTASLSLSALRATASCPTLLSAQPRGAHTAMALLLSPTCSWLSVLLGYPCTGHQACMWPHPWGTTSQPESRTHWGGDQAEGRWRRDQLRAPSSHPFPSHGACHCHMLLLFWWASAEGEGSGLPTVFLC